MNLILVALLLIFLVVFLTNRGVKQTKKKSLEKPNIQTGSGETFITPKNYELGYSRDPWSFATLCGSKVLYPIQQLEVDYGSKMPQNCPCTEFVQPP